MTFLNAIASDGAANLGNVVGGFSTFVLAVIAVLAGAATFPEWRAKLKNAAALAREQKETIQRDRRRWMNGWSDNRIKSYRVRLVTDRAEMARAQEELTSGGPSSYVILLVDEANTNRGGDLRTIIETDGFIAQNPTDAEREAVEVGATALIGADPSARPRRRGVLGRS